MGKTIEQQIEVMKAFENGSKVQLKRLGTVLPWEDISEPAWNWGDFDYRVRPETVTTVLDVKNIKQFFEEYKGDKVADANNVLDQILSSLTSASYEHIIEWLSNNTQEIESAGFVSENAIDKEFMEENYPDLCTEIKNDGVDVNELDDGKIEEAARRWMNSAYAHDIIDMIKDEA